MSMNRPPEISISEVRAKMTTLVKMWRAFDFGFQLDDYPVDADPWNALVYVTVAAYWYAEVRAEPWPSPYV